MMLLMSKENLPFMYLWIMLACKTHFFSFLEDTLIILFYVICKLISLQITKNEIKFEFDRDGGCPMSLHKNQVNILNFFVIFLCKKAGSVNSHNM